jgi:hypothetical protein
VQFKETSSQRHFDKVQAEGGKLGARLGLVNGGAFSLPAAALRILRTITRSLLSLPISPTGR